MNSKVLMVLAGLLLVGAVLLGYLGVSIGRAPSTVQVPAVAPATSVVDASLEKLERKPVLVASRDLPALAVIGKDDLVVEMLRTAPAGSYDKPEALLGKRVWVAVPAGSILSAATLEPGGPLARTIRADERAMAIAVDEVIGGGGFVLPGDYVDVMLFVRDERGGESTSLAQLVLPGVRVLTYGERIAVGGDGQDRSATEKDPRPPRTAVLAVPAEGVARLVLASQAGALRLAIRSQDEELYRREQEGPLLRASLGAPGAALTLDQLLERRKATPAGVRSAAPRAPAAAGVAVYRGSAMTHEAP
ncbi:type 4b pilus Flp biogenesis protein RcpC [Pseudomonas aeruginosa]|uniref:type 4b pilus Flp biogenesis protein RcpC n=1 Tax=Pseudomonas aeruginosa TaxID=287 RepID=UPI00071C0533|nr:type 4b pilus Flp biogenesis protein RcpC [Pseudomonas aeruginosa]KSR44388.1 Flp pilus assembly protein CpaB [Pseudomonas aeruginosa]RPU98216.1 Flp pilus assembly protein CpaB [Pseudomonas aeruginosa]